LQNARGKRVVPVSEFFQGPQKTAKNPDEILTEVIIPVQKGASAFMKLGRRKAFTLSVVSAAAFARVRRGKFEEVRLALGAVAPTPLRSRKVEEALKGKEASEENITRAADLIREEVKPISDVRASEAYRREMSAVLTRRVLGQVGGRESDESTI
jgi:CO/xanthine dehydrogenase FAD-binding subunit